MERANIHKRQDLAPPVLLSRNRRLLLLLGFFSRKVSEFEDKKKIRFNSNRVRLTRNQSQSTVAKTTLRGQKWKHAMVAYSRSRSTSSAASTFRMSNGILFSNQCKECRAVIRSLMSWTNDYLLRFCHDEKKAQSYKMIRCVRLETEQESGSKLVIRLFLLPCHASPWASQRHKGDTSPIRCKQPPSRQWTRHDRSWPWWPMIRQVQLGCFNTETLTHCGPIDLSRTLTSPTGNLFRKINVLALYVCGSSEQGPFSLSKWTPFFCLMLDRFAYQKRVLDRKSPSFHEREPCQISVACWKA